MIEQEYRQKLDEYIISQLRGKAGVKETLDAIAQQYEVLQDDLKGLLNWTSIDTAEGDLLDYIGYLFGITRDYFDISQYFCMNVDDINRSKYFFFKEASAGNAGGGASLGDENFRSRIKAKIGLKFSNRTRNENIKIIKDMTFADDVNITALNDFQYTKSNKLINIPQDVKLELNEGVLTLKAGSKVYVPNGFESDGTTPKFKEVLVSSDIDITPSSDGEVMIFVHLSGDYLINRVTSKCISGPTRTLTQTYMLWYDTATNYCKNYGSDSSTVSGYASFPVAVVSVVSGAVQSIDQVFNGFGYIGSTAFALPKVKGLIPYGYFPDRSIRNIEFTLKNVFTDTNTNSAVKTKGIYFNENGEAIGTSNGIYIETIPSLSDRPTTWTSGYCIYVEDENRNYINQSNEPSLVFMYANIEQTSSRITSFTPMQVDTDYSTGSQMMLNIDLIGDPNKMFITDKTLAEIESVLGYGVGLNALTINGV